MIQFRLLRIDDAGLLGFAQKQARRLIESGQHTWTRTWNVNGAEVRVRSTHVTPGEHTVTISIISTVEFAATMSPDLQFMTNLMVNFAVADQLTAISDAGLTKEDGTPYVAADLTPFSVGVRDGKLAFSTEVDESLIRVAMVGRLLKQSNFSLAEAILRIMKFDGALYTDEGLYIDSSYYSAEPYFEKLKSVAEDYFSAFTHNVGDAVPVLFTEPAYDISTYQVPLGSDGPAPYRQFAIINADLSETRLADVDYAFHGTTGVRVYELRSSILSQNYVGPVYHRRLETSTSAFVTASHISWRKFEGINSQYLRWAETPYVTFTNYPPFWSAWRDVTNDTLANNALAKGSLVGLSKSKAALRTSRRTKTGWVEVSKTVMTPQEVLPFTVNGSLAYVTPPTGSVMVNLTYMQNGTSIPVGTATYNASSVSVTSGPTTFTELYLNINKDARGPYGSGAQAIYDSPVITITVDVAAIYRSRFTDKAGRTYDVLLNGDIEIREPKQPSESQGVSLKSIPPNVRYTSTSVEVKNIFKPFSAERKDYLYTDAANEATMNAAARINVVLDVYNVTKKPYSAPMPPTILGETYVMFCPRTAAVLYFKITSTVLVSEEDFEAAIMIVLEHEKKRKAFIMALRLNQPEAVVTAKREAFASAFTTVYENGGLSPDLLALTGLPLFGIDPILIL